MSNPLEMLEIVDENDNVIGVKTRGEIHKKGLLHREIHIWFITSNGEMVFQHRAKDKDTYPDKLDATVGGHVEPGMSYEETAIKECKEETGIDIDLSKLVFLDKLRKKEEEVSFTNETIRSQYAYLYEKPLEQLQIEKGKAIGFEVWKIDNLQNLSLENKNKFIPTILGNDMITLFKKAKEILIK